MAAAAVAEALEGHGLPSLGPVRTNARVLPAEPPTPCLSPARRAQNITTKP